MGKRLTQRGMPEWLLRADKGKSIGAFTMARLCVSRRVRDFLVEFDLSGGAFVIVTLFDKQRAEVPERNFNWTY
ncbi:MAG: hypothetical protein AAF501_04390 [Pseudomonadota bacterium]